MSDHNLNKTEIKRQVSDIHMYMHRQYDIRCHTLICVYEIIPVNINCEDQCVLNLCISISD